VNVDVVESRAGMRPDVICDLHDLAPFAADSADEILSVHVVEHFWRWEVRDVLREWVRVLKPGGPHGGRMPQHPERLPGVPREPAQELARGPGRPAHHVGFLWRSQVEGPAHDPSLGLHPRFPEALLSEVGLGEVRQEPAQFKLREPRDMRVVGVKP
jgi:SAM-dependent methyltransferase